MKQHILRAGAKRLAAASPLGAVWGIVLQEDDSETIELRWQTVAR